MEHAYPFHIHAPARGTVAPPLCGREDVPLSAIVAPDYLHAVDCPGCCAILGVEPAVHVPLEGDAPDLSLIDNDGIVVVHPEVRVSGSEVSITVSVPLRLM